MNLESLIVSVVWAVLLLGYPIYVCVRKGKPVFAAIGVLGIIPPLLLLVGWFPIVGALRLAKPDSRWAHDHYPPLKMVGASRRFKKPPPQSQASAAVVEPTLDDAPPQRRDDVVEFLFEAWSRGLIDQATHQNLVAFLDAPGTVSAPVADIAPVAPVVVEPVSSLAAVPETVLPAAEATTEPVLRPPLPPPSAIERKIVPKPDPWAPWRRQFGRFGQAVVSELALHGFVYLGVLLTFVGVFGFLFFSFRDVPDDAQPLVELAIPVIFFVWAWALRRRQATMIGKAMELLGGMVLPLVLFAGLVDNAAFPPDARGGGLIVAMVVTSLVVAFVYMWWSARHPASALAYLVAPMIWLGAMVLGFVFKNDEALEGVAITRLVSFQPALACVALAATLAAVAFRPDHRLARATSLAALPTTAVLYILTVSLSGGEGWVRPEPVLLAGVFSLISVELLGSRFDRVRTVAALRPLLLAVAVAPLIPLWGLAWTGAIVVVTYLAVLEWELRTGPTGEWSRAIALAGAVVGLATSVLEPWPAVAAWAVATVWSHARRVTGLPGDTSGLPLAAFASIASFGLGSGLLRALPDDIAWISMGAVVLTLVGVVRRLRSEDPFWAPWLTAAASIVALGAAADWYFDQREAASAPLLVLAITMAAATLAGSSRRPALGVWMTSAALALALAVGLDGANLAEEVRPLVWAAVGLSAVVAAAFWPHSVAGHIGVVGHLIGAGSLLPSVPPGYRSVLLGAWTAGWLVTVIAGANDTRSVSGLLELTGQSFGGWWGRVGRALPPAVLTASAPFALLEAAGLWERFARNRAWSGVALGMLAIAYAVVARRLIQRKPVSSVFATGAAILSVISVAVAAPEPWPSIGTAAASIVVAALIAGELSRSAFTWFAWIMSGVLVVLLANRAGVPVDSLHLVSLSWGGVLLIGGLLFDDNRAGRRQIGEGLRVAWVRYPVLVGALAVPLSLGPAFTRAPAVFGWWSLGTGVGYFVVAYLLRVGAVTGPAYAFTALAIAVLSPESPMARPWLFVPLAAALVGCSFVADRRSAGSENRAGWLRWDLPPLVVAHLVGAVALARTYEVGFVPSTTFGLGLLSIAVGLWRRNRIWGEAGNVLILVGASALGPQWLALALVATSARGVVSAMLTRGWTRVSYQVIAAGAAGWSFLQTIVWQDWTVAETVAVSGLVFGGLGAMVGVLVRFWRLPRDWAVTWGVLAVAGTVVTTAVATDNIDGFGPALGMALFALGFGLTARPLNLRAAETWTTVLTGVAWVELIAGAGWSLGRAVAITSIGAGSLALVSAIVVRFGILSRSWATSLGTLSLVALTAAWVVALVPTMTQRVDGPGPAIGWGLLAIACAVAARPLAAQLHYLSVGTAVWAWLTLALGLQWNAQTAAFWTAIIFGGLSAVVAVAVRAPRVATAAHLPGPDQVLRIGVAQVWAATSAAGVLAATFLAVPSVERRPVWPVVAAAMGLLAISAARAAVPLRWPWLRETSGSVAVVAVTALAYGLEATAIGIASGALALGVAATALLLGFGRRNRDSLWLRPLAVTGVIANVEALVLAFGSLPRRDLLVVVLLGVGVQAVAVGLVLDRPAILAIGPPLISVAWIGIAADSFTGSAQWYTAPVALTLLAEVEVARWSSRRGRQMLGPSQLLILEWAGIGLLSLSPLAEMFTGGVGFGLLAFGYSAALLIWGAMTRVRRRVVAAAVLASVTTALTISAAAAGEAPPSAFFWIIAAGAGLALMLAIGIVEAYRSKSGAIMHRLEGLMEGWE